MTIPLKETFNAPAAPNFAAAARVEEEVIGDPGVQPQCSPDRRGAGDEDPGDRA
jgi:hypothetical protein